MGDTLSRRQTAAVHVGWTVSSEITLLPVTMVCKCVIKISVSVFVSQYFELNLKEKMFLNCIY